MREIAVLVIFLIAIAIALYFALQPIAEAWEFRIKTKAEQNALDSEQARRQRAERFEALIPLYRPFGVLLLIAVCVLVGVGAGLAYAQVKARVRAADLRRVPLPETGAYPLLVLDSGDSGWQVVNANTGHVIACSEPGDPVPQLIPGDSMVRLTNAMGNSAARIAAKSGEDAGAAVTGWSGYNPPRPLLED